MALSSLVAHSAELSSPRCWRPRAAQRRRAPSALASANTSEARRLPKGGRRAAPSSEMLRCSWPIWSAPGRSHASRFTWERTPGCDWVSGSRIIIDRYLVDAGGEFRLEAGAMLFDRPSGGPLPVQVRSPFGLIAVRGTRFFAGPSAQVFGVFVERGTVGVSAAGREVTVSSGQGTDIARPGAPPTPVKAWGEPRIREALASVF